MLLSKEPHTELSTAPTATGRGTGDEQVAFRALGHEAHRRERVLVGGAEDPAPLKERPLFEAGLGR